MTIRRYFLLLSHLVILPFSIKAQDSFFNSIELCTDTAKYSSDLNSIVINGVDRLCFYYEKPEQVAEVRLYPREDNYTFEVRTSRDFELIDSLIYTGQYYRFKVRFVNLNRSELLRITLGVENDSILTFEEILLQPLTKTKANIRPVDDELFIGEEKVFEVFSNNLENISVSSEWVNNDGFDYRYSKEDGKVFIHIVPKKLGRHILEAAIRGQKPYLNEAGHAVYDLKPIIQGFMVKASRLQFLNLDQNEVTLSDITRKDGIEVQLDNSRMLAMNKTYRIEGQEEKGGALIAEVFTKRRLGNNRVLCILRPYNFHRSSDGYLYIKDGDNPKFITNFSITPATGISEILILHEGNVWRKTNRVKPGQTVDVKLVGEGMHKANFYFEDLLVIAHDSLVKTETQQSFRLKVPVDITKKTINIYNHSKLTGHNLIVTEYQEPREFDFIYVDYGDRARRVSGIKEPILYEGLIKDMVISFNNNQIDKGELFGKQYLNMEVRITGKKGELVELKRIENIAVCPSGKSPRIGFYNESDCFNGELSLNKYIRKETSDLDDWSRISLNISHNNDKYPGMGYEKDVEVILKRKYSFDIELSFPAGLITISKQDNDSVGFGSLSGISLAMIGQFSFYHPEKINRYRPYKLGAGFLALNAFNFSDNASNRDVGLVVLASLYPTTRDTKLSFPLYVGGGYFIKDAKFFFLIGPGIRLRL